MTENDLTVEYLVGQSECAPVESPRRQAVCQCRGGDLELVVIRGLPGSGKSTRAQQAFPGHLHYEPDQFFCDTQGRYRFDLQLWDRAHLWVRTMTDFALARGESVVVSDVFPRLDELAPYRRLAKMHGAAFRVEICTERFGSIHRVPETIVDEMRAAFEFEDKGQMS